MTPGRPTSRQAHRARRHGGAPLGGSGRFLEGRRPKYGGRRYQGKP